MGRAMCSAIGSADGCQGQVHLGGRRQVEETGNLAVGRGYLFRSRCEAGGNEELGTSRCRSRQVGRDRGGSRVLVLWSRPFGGVAGQLQRNDCIETIVF